MNRAFCYFQPTKLCYTKSKLPVVMADGHTKWGKLPSTAPSQHITAPSSEQRVPQLELVKLRGNGDLLRFENNDLFIGLGYMG
jgi:hypothetical protein